MDDELQELNLSLYQMYLSDLSIAEKNGGTCFTEVLNLYGILKETLPQEIITKIETILYELELSKKLLWSTLCKFHGNETGSNYYSNAHRSRIYNVSNAKSSKIAAFRIKTLIFTKYENKQEE